MAATDLGASKFERFEARVDIALAGRIESSDVEAKRQREEIEDDDLAALRGSVRLEPPPSEREVPGVLVA